MIDVQKSLVSSYDTGCNMGSIRVGGKRKVLVYVRWCAVGASMVRIDL